MAKSVFHVCYHCKDRKVGCHSTCEAYLKEKQENEKMRQEKIKEAKINDGIYNSASNRIKSLKRKRNTPK